MAKNKPWNLEKWENPTAKRRNGRKEMRAIPVATDPPPAPPVNDGLVTYTPIHYGLGLGSYTYAGIERRLPQSPFTRERVGALNMAAPRYARRTAPDFIEAITAWRAWDIKPVGGEWRLSALGVAGIWNPKEAMAADCKIADRYTFWGDGRQPQHLAPDFKCECGIWSFRSLEILLKAMQEYENAKVIGQVSIWGRVIECENGYRSQFAYPKELWLLNESMEQLGYIYGVPIRTAK